MKFSNILLAAFGFSTFAAAFPAPVPAPDTSLNVFEKRELLERDPAGDLVERTGCANLIADVQVCIDAVVAINSKYTAKKTYTRGSCQSWAAEVVAKIKVLIAVITAYPSGCSYPPINDCVGIFVKLIVTIFVQLKVFIDLGGLLGILLLTVDLLLSLLLGLCGDLLHIVVTLLVLIEVKIKVGICALILKGCGGLLPVIWVQVLIKLCLQVGISV
ncbi:hypothetical protein TWF730_004230 [Orbilia blumenaviensis]|uniref:Uncharacterized protein n=1 Tax=Orbilia blumenaviensis TaxID=1796055 RepID=A0AAV9U046_9PEZI